MDYLLPLGALGLVIVGNPFGPTIGGAAAKVLS